MAINNAEMFTPVYLYGDCTCTFSWPEMYSLLPCSLIWNLLHPWNLCRNTSGRKKQVYTRKTLQSIWYKVQHGKSNWRKAKKAEKISALSFGIGTLMYTITWRAKLNTKLCVALITLCRCNDNMPFKEGFYIISKHTVETTNNHSFALIVQTL